jgi:hypothetical protein
MVRPDSLSAWIRPEDPLHSAYNFLSSTHRSDYLRSYFMFHYGGGYADIKSLAWHWRPYLEALESDSVEIDFYGSPEQSPMGVAGGEYLRPHYRSLVSNGAFIFRPHTPFAREWKARVARVLDAHLDLVLKRPGTYHPRAVVTGIHSYGRLDFRRGPRGYPLRWAEIQGEIFHPLQFERRSSFRAALPPLSYGRYR